MPPSLEERVAYLEGKVEEHSRSFGDIQESIARVDSHVLDVGSRITAVDQKVDRFREELASRIDGMDDRLGGRIEDLDKRLGGRIDALDQKVSSQFVWLVGLQFAVLLSVIAALLAG